MRHGVVPPPLRLAKRFDDSFVRFDGSEVLNVDRVSDIPCDYNGLMGVPLTFLPKHNPTQFELVDTVLGSVAGRRKYTRIVIRRC